MGILQRCAVLGVVLSVSSACTAPPGPLYKRLANANGAMPPGLTCPVMTTAEYNNRNYKTMLGPSPENPLICLEKQKVGEPRSLVLNWYAVDRLRPTDVDQAVEILTSVVTGPVGFTTRWNRFLVSNFPYVTQFTVEPDRSMMVGDKTYEVRVIKATSQEEDNEYWIDKESLLILKYMNYNMPSRNYTVTALAKNPKS